MLDVGSLQLRAPQIQDDVPLDWAGRIAEAEAAIEIKGAPLIWSTALEQLLEFDRSFAGYLRVRLAFSWHR